MGYMYFHLFKRCAGCPLPRTTRNRQVRGFTFLEVMVVVAILGVLAALAGPSFTPIVERWRVRDSAEALTSSLYYARSEALKRGGNIIVAKNPNAADCTTATAPAEWGCGWRVFFDANGNGSQDTCDATVTPNECDLQVTVAPVRVQINFPDSPGSLTVDRWGMLSHTGGAAPTFFELMPKGKTLADPSAAKLCTATGGRIARIEGSTSCSS